MTEPEPQQVIDEPGVEDAADEPGQKPPEWRIFGIDYDKRGVEWVLWALTDDEQIYAGRVVANGGEFYLGDFETAESHWRAFATQTKRSVR